MHVAQMVYSALGAIIAALCVTWLLLGLFMIVTNDEDD